MAYLQLIGEVLHVLNYLTFWCFSNKALLYLYQTENDVKIGTKN